MTKNKYTISRFEARSLASAWYQRADLVDEHYTFERFNDRNQFRCAHRVLSSLRIPEADLQRMELEDEIRAASTVQKVNGAYYHLENALRNGWVPRTEQIEVIKGSSVGRKRLENVAFEPSIRRSTSEVMQPAIEENITFYEVLDLLINTDYSQARFGDLVISFDGKDFEVFVSTARAKRQPFTLDDADDYGPGHTDATETGGTFALSADTPADADTAP